MLELNFTCVIFIISFLVFVYFLDQTLWKPIRKIKEERDSDLIGEKEKAKEAEEKTKSIIEKVNSEIEAIKKSERELIDSLFKSFNDEKEQEELKIKQELEIKKQKAFEEIEVEREGLLKSINQESADLANVIVGKLAPEVNLSGGVSAK
ncbi:MAG: hypothetical protein QNJ31_01175 [Candidatus Caenarcaniphilales bacterium]|nr:hypothetical protein [Candidatus Caenarcaniphilales bacterium]